MAQTTFQVQFDDLIGKTITDVLQSDDLIEFKTTDGTTYQMYHSQDCCESVYVGDIAGDLNSLIGETVLQAYEETSTDLPPLGEYDESYTWTFYRIRTIKDTIVIRWYGTSNGYYSESVEFYKIVP